MGSGPSMRHQGSMAAGWTRGGPAGGAEAGHGLRKALHAFAGLQDNLHCTISRIHRRLVAVSKRSDRKLLTPFPDYIALSSRSPISCPTPPAYGRARSAPAGPR